MGQEPDYSWLSIAGSPRLFDESLDLIRAVEDRLAKSPRRSKVLRSMNRALFVPAYLLLRGIGQLAAQFGKAYVYISVAISMGVWFTPLLAPAAQVVADRASAVGVAVIVLLFLFAAPSTYCATDITAQHVAIVSDRLVGASKDRVELLLRSCHMFEDRVKRRLSMFKWALGIAWAIYVAPLLPQISDSAVHRMDSSSLRAIALLFVAYLFVEAYGRGVDIVFRSIDLGCNERLAAIRTLELQKA